MAALRVVAQQLLLAGQGLRSAFQVAAPPLVLVEREDRPQVGVGEPLDLLAQVRLGAAQRVAAGEQFLRQPRSAMGPRNGRDQWLWLTQQGA